MFSYRRKANEFMKPSACRHAPAFCPTVVGQGFNTQHPHSESPMLRHRKDPKDIFAETRDFLAQAKAQREEIARRERMGYRVLPTLNA